MKNWRDILIPHLKEFEGFRHNAYRDSAGVLTIGYGTTKGVRPGDTITHEEAERRMLKDVASHAEPVLGVIDVVLSEHEKAAIASWSYNVGVGAAINSTLIRRLNKGERHAAADEFLRWNKAGGRVLRGLTRRRKAERKMFLTPDEAVPAPPPRPDVPIVVAGGSAAVIASVGTGYWWIAGLAVVAAVAFLIFRNREAIREKLR